MKAIIQMSGQDPFEATGSKEDIEYEGQTLAEVLLFNNNQEGEIELEWSEDEKQLNVYIDA